MQQEIERALRPLLSQPLWGRARAADMEMFSFGDPVQATVGKKRIVGTFALHVECPWRLRTEETMIVGSQDLLVPADDDVDLGDYDWDEHESRRDRIMGALFPADGSDCPRVLAVEGDALGGARITLDNGMTLEIWPADTDTNECAEHWRFFRNTDESPHFVVTTAGVVDD